MSLIKAENNFR